MRRISERDLSRFNIGIFTTSLTNNAHGVDTAGIGRRNKLLSRFKAGQAPGGLLMSRTLRRSQAPTLKLQRQRAEVVVVDSNEP